MTRRARLHARRRNRGPPRPNPRTTRRRPRMPRLTPRVTTRRRWQRARVPLRSIRGMATRRQRRRSGDRPRRWRVEGHPRRQWVEDRLRPRQGGGRPSQRWARGSPRPRCRRAAMGLRRARGHPRRRPRGPRPVRERRPRISRRGASASHGPEGVAWANAA